MNLGSIDFEEEGSIPEKFTCDGLNINPALFIDSVPEEAESLALMVEDPDAPNGVWTHWLVWNIPPETTDIDQSGVPEGAVEGINSSGGEGYQGPCPPSGVHHYIFHLYALDTTIDLDNQSGRDDFMAAAEGHIIAEAELIGTYGSN